MEKDNAGTIEVTEEMIEAGERAIASRWLELTAPNDDTLKVVATETFLAMLSASRGRACSGPRNRDSSDEFRGEPL